MTRGMSKGHLEGMHGLGGMPAAHLLPAPQTGPEVLEFVVPEGLDEVVGGPGREASDDLLPVAVRAEDCAGGDILC